MTGIPPPTSSRQRIWVATLSGPNKLFSVEVDENGTVDDLAVAICKRDPSFEPSTSLAIYALMSTISIHPRANLFNRIADQLDLDCVHYTKSFRRLVESNTISSTFRSNYPTDKIGVVLDVHNKITTTEYSWDSRDFYWKKI